MNISNSNFKTSLIAMLEKRDVYFKEKPPQYITKCPLCGDNDNPYDGHFYIRIDPDDNYPVVYHCFKCDMGGIMKPEILDALGVCDVNMKSGLLSLNKTSDKFDSKGIYNEGTGLRTFNFKIPKFTRGKKTEYVEGRIGRNLSDKEFEDLKIITSIHRFLIDNDISTYSYSKDQMNILEKDFVGFLSFGASHILLRDITGKTKQWLKYPITKKSADNVCFYAISSEIDFMSTEKIIINLSEGVMDIVGIYANFNQKNSNTINIAVTGKYYSRILLFLLDLGLAGSNIELNIYSDNDAMFNKKAKNPTTFTYFQNILKRYKHLYGKVKIHYNMINKDFGYPKKDIMEEVKILK